MATATQFQPLPVLEDPIAFAKLLLADRDTHGALEEARRRIKEDPDEYVLLIPKLIDAGIRYAIWTASGQTRKFAFNHEPGGEIGEDNGYLPKGISGESLDIFLEQFRERMKRPCLDGFLLCDGKCLGDSTQVDLEEHIKRADQDIQGRTANNKFCKAVLRERKKRTKDSFLPLRDVLTEEDCQTAKQKTGAQF